MEESSVVSSTQNESPEPCRSCVKLQSRLERALRQLERQIKFGDEVRNENEQLKQQLQILKRKNRDDAGKTSKRSKSYRNASTQIENCQYYLNTTYNGGMSSVDGPVSQDLSAAVNSSTAAVTSNGDPELVAAATGANENGEQSVADMLRDAANECISHNGYVYDEKSGLYYDYNSGYYYDPHRKLFYEPRSGTYYAYDEEKREYHFHSRENAARLKRHCEQLFIQTGGQHAPPPRRSKVVRESRRKEEVVVEEVEDCARVECEEEAEEGEITSEEEEKEEEENDEEEEDEEGEWEEEIEDSGPVYAPCVRLMVTDSETAAVGTLFVVTCEGGTIGRSSKKFVHAVTLDDDEEVGECPAEFCFDEERCGYSLRVKVKSARVSVNGEVVKKSSGLCSLQHADTLVVGGTTMQVHIHAGTETCDGCEPGVAKAQARDLSKEIELANAVTLESQRRSEMKRIRSKFGLRGAPFETGRPRGRDRAAERRSVKGSDDGGSATRREGTSAHRHLPESNKGATMLAKMGWKPGQSLGKSGADGILEPVTAEVRLDPQAGLGSDLPSVSLDAGSDPSQMNRIRNWKKMRDRYERLEETAPDVK